METSGVGRRGGHSSGAEGRSFQLGRGELIPVGRRGGHSSGAEGRSFHWGGAANANARRFTICSIGHVPQLVGYSKVKIKHK